MSGPTFEVASAYTDQGCNIRGHLVIVRYAHLIPRATAANFGQHTHEDWAERCRGMVVRKYGQYTRVRLGVPALVVEYDAPPKLRE